MTLQHTTASAIARSQRDCRVPMFPPTKRWKHRLRQFAASVVSVVFPLERCCHDVPGQGNRDASSDFAITISLSAGAGSAAVSPPGRGADA